MIDAGSVAQVGLVAVGYAIGPMIVARRLAAAPSLGVVTVPRRAYLRMLAEAATVPLPRAFR